MADPLTRLRATDPLDQIVAALTEHGAVIVEELLGGETLRKLNEELTPQLEQVSPAAPINSIAALMVSAWYRVTRCDFALTTSPAVSVGFCVATPTGQSLLLHLRAWMQPIDIIIERAA